MADELQGSLTTLDERVQVMPAVAQRVILAHAIKVVAQAKPLWPVKTGRSKAALKAEPVPSGAAVVDAVEYATVIESEGVNPWDAYVVAPLTKAAAGEMLDEIGQELIDDLAKGA